MHQVLNVLNAHSFLHDPENKTNPLGLNLDRLKCPPCSEGLVPMDW